MSEDNETQPSYLNLWKQTILELEDPPSVTTFPLLSSFSSLCKLYHFFLLFQRNLSYGK